MCVVRTSSIHVTARRPRRHKKRPRSASRDRLAQSRGPRRRAARVGPEKDWGRLARLWLVRESRTRPMGRSQSAHWELRAEGGAKRELNCVLVQFSFMNRCYPGKPESWGSRNFLTWRWKEIHVEEDSRKLYLGEKRSNREAGTCWYCKGYFGLQVKHPWLYLKQKYSGSGCWSLLPLLPSEFHEGVPLLILENQGNTIEHHRRQYRQTIAWEPSMNNWEKQCSIRDRH